MPEPNDFAGLSELLTSDKFQAAVGEFADKIPDLGGFLTERGITLPADVTLTFELAAPPKKDPPPKKCWKICIGKPPWGACFEHCSG